MDWLRLQVRVSVISRLGPTLVLHCPLLRGLTRAPRSGSLRGQAWANSGTWRHTHAVAPRKGSDESDIGEKGTR